MNAPTHLTTDQERLLDQVVQLSASQELDRLVEEQPELQDPALREPAVIEALCERSTQLLRVDVSQAESLSSLALRLARDLDQPRLRARGLRAHANALQMQGDNDRAIELFEESVETYLGAGEQLNAAITRSSALQALTHVGQHDRCTQWAELARETFENENDVLRLGRLDLNLGFSAFRQEHFEQARALTESAYERLLEVGGPGDVAHCLRNLATIHISLRNFEQAEETYERAREHCKKAELPLLLGEVEYNIAYLYYLRGEYTTAIEHYRRTRERCEETGELYHHALCDLDEAEIYLELNLIDETVRATDAAYREFEQLGLRYESSKALFYLAIARIRQGKTILGLSLLDQARAVFAEDHYEIWLGLIDLYKAVALAREGRRFEAEGLASSAQQTFLANAMGGKASACEALRASLRIKDGDYPAARRLCDRALERLAELDLPSLEYQTLYVLGRVEEAAGGPASALAAYEAAHHKLSRSRSTAQADELKIPLIEDKLKVYERLVSLLIDGRHPRDPEKAFEYMEIAKARNMVDLLAARGLALPTRKARSAQVERVRRLREELNWYYRRLDLTELTGSELGADNIDELRRETRRTEDELAQGLREVALIDPEYAALQTATTGRLDEIRGLLRNDDALVEYYSAGDTLYACVLCSDRLEIQPVSLTSRVHDLYRQLSDQLLKFRLGQAHLSRFHDSILSATDDVLGRLYDELFEPLEGAVESARRLVVVPHRFLNWLPFHAFHDGTGYLVDRFATIYSPTATAYLRSMSTAAAATSGSLVLAAPASAHAEAEQLGSILPDARVLAGSEATIENLRALGADRRYLHLAGDAHFRADNPMFSSIDLSDGQLSLFDLYSLKLDAEMVVLSGCGGQASSLTDGDEWLGLARGFLYAGARSIALPLWNPPPEARGPLLRAFLSSVAGAEEPPVALQRAMREVKNSRPHPFYWASLALIGSSR